MRAVYEKLGLDFQPAHEAAMKRWLVENAPQKQAKHYYSLEEFGLSAADVSGLRWGGVDPSRPRIAVFATPERIRRSRTLHPEEAARSPRGVFRPALEGSTAQ